jgi:hypothetical protein
MTRILFAVIFIALFSCDFYDGRLSVTNNTAKIICIETISDTEPNLNEFNSTEYYLNAPILPGSSKKLIKTGRNIWEKEIQKSFNGKLNIIVFDIDSMLKYKSLEYLLDNKKYETVSYSLSEIRKRDWKIPVKK